MGRLGEAVERHMLQPFAWDGCCCLSAVAGVLVDLGYPDIAAPFRGLYSDPASAQAVGRVEDRAAERFAELGWPEIDPAEARDADVGVSGNSLFIRSAGRWWGKSEGGVRTRAAVRRAWRPQ